MRRTNLVEVALLEGCVAALLLGLSGAQLRDPRRSRRVSALLHARQHALRTLPLPLVLVLPSRLLQQAVMTKGNSEKMSSMSRAVQEAAACARGSCGKDPALLWQDGVPGGAAPAFHKAVQGTHVSGCTLTQGALLETSGRVKSRRWKSSSLSNTRARKASPCTCAVGGRARTPPSSGHNQGIRARPRQGSKLCDASAVAHVVMLHAAQRHAWPVHDRRPAGECATRQLLPSAQAGAAQHLQGPAAACGDGGGALVDGRVHEGGLVVGVEVDADEAVVARVAQQRVALHHAQVAGIRQQRLAHPPPLVLWQAGQQLLPLPRSLLLRFGWFVLPEVRLRVT